MKTRHFVEVEENLKFWTYAAGYAAILEKNLHNHVGITKDELAWLEQLNGGRACDPDEMIRHVFHKYIIAQTVDRITSKITRTA
jgi:hypothetical protein